MFEFLFILGIFLFVALLVSPLVLLYIVGANPKIQEKIKIFFNKNLKYAVLIIVLIGLGFQIKLIFHSLLDGTFNTLCVLYLEVFLKYFGIIIVFGLFSAIIMFFKKR